MIHYNYTGTEASVWKLQYNDIGIGSEKSLKINKNLKDKIFPQQK